EKMFQLPIININEPINKLLYFLLEKVARANEKKKFIHMFLSLCIGAAVHIIYIQVIQVFRIAEVSFCSLTQHHMYGYNHQRKEVEERKNDFTHNFVTSIVIVILGDEYNLVGDTHGGYGYKYMMIYDVSKPDEELWTQEQDLQMSPKYSERERDVSDLI
ncbi:hypothetical protein ACJX0J_036009, partial [Zea mays]